MALATTSSLLANIKKSQGFSRSNRFVVDITLPEKVMQKVGEEVRSRISFNAKSASLPGRSMAVSATRYSGGYEHKHASDVTFSDLEIQFYLSQDLIEKQVIDAWQSFVFDPAYQVSSYPEDYYGSITVSKYSIGTDNRLVAAYTYHNAFPSNLIDVAQDYDTDSAVDVISTQFSYHRWSYAS